MSLLQQTPFPALHNPTTFSQKAWGSCTTYTPCCLGCHLFLSLTTYTTTHFQQSVKIIPVRAATKRDIAGKKERTGGSFSYPMLSVYFVVFMKTTISMSSFNSWVIAWISCSTEKQFWTFVLPLVISIRLERHRFVW